jgi:hypothetical protein
MKILKICRAGPQLVFTFNNQFSATKRVTVQGGGIHGEAHRTVPDVLNKIEKGGKVGREGLIMPTWNQLLLPVNCGILAISWQDL